MDKCLLTLVFGLSMLGGCLARVVTVSPGPLIRVEGQPVSIRCDVSDYMGPLEQDFEWMMSKDGNQHRIKIISTFDASYSHQSLSKRVASGDISVVRLQDSEVELKIAEVKAQDAGNYWCQTPSTDFFISGNYEAQVQLIVIPNNLKVSPQTPLPVVPEGSDITLSCNVTQELTQPTYLSVTWSLKKGATSEEILTFGPQGGVATGQKYARRYADGGIRLVLGKNGLFELVISRVTKSDEGIYECNGTEWTHENGGKWIKIAEKTKEMGTVAVTATELPGCHFWIMVGKGGLVLLLIIIVIVCCIWARKKRSMKVKDEEELRLGWTNSEQQQQHEHNHPPDQHHHHHQQQPMGHTGPRQHRHKQHRDPRSKVPDIPNLGVEQQVPRPVDNVDDY